MQEQRSNETSVSPTVLGDSIKSIVEIDAYANQEQKSDKSSMRLKIPAIGVNSAVILVGLTSDGAMDAPRGPAEVALFNFGPRPGERGSAVIAGHYNWINNIPAVFDDLHKIRAGDKIIFEDEEGLPTVFIVREIKIYDKNDSAADVFISSDSKSHLNLITCTGSWNEAEKTFSNRLVVFADKE